MISDILVGFSNNGMPIMKLKAGSYSRLEVFEKCPLQAKLKFLDKIPEPERPLPLGKTEHANDRGSRIHDAAEKYVKGGVELIPELSKFSAEFNKAREMYEAGEATTEGEWAFTREWESVAWMSSNVWCRIKCDLVLFTDDGSAVVVDYKSGKKYGNEIKHNEQMQLYVIGALCKYPELKKVTTELWYLDLDDLSTLTYTRAQGLSLVPRYEDRMEKLTSCEDWPANPNKFSCKWCPYLNGPCTVGVK